MSGLKCIDNSKKTGEKPWHSEVQRPLLKKSSMSSFMLAKESLELKNYSRTMELLRSAVCSFDSAKLERNNNESGSLLLEILNLTAKALVSIKMTEDAEEEATLLTTAKSILADPIKEWICIYNKVFEMPDVMNQPQSVIDALKKTYADNLMKFGCEDVKIYSEKVKNKERFSAIEQKWNDTLQNFLKAFSLYKQIGNRNMAGETCCNIGNLYTPAAAAVDDSPTEQDTYSSKVLYWYHTSLKYFTDDQVTQREDVNQILRSYYIELIKEFLTKLSRQITSKDLRNIEDLAKKALSCCFTNASTEHVKNSKICKAAIHLCQAKVFEIKAKICKKTSRKKIIKKAEKEYTSAFDIYDDLRWRRSQIYCKDQWIKTLVSLKAEEDLPDLLNPMLDCVPVLTALHDGDFDAEDVVGVNPLTSAVKTIVTSINALCKFLLKDDKNNVQVKLLYGRNLKITGLMKTETSIDDLLLPVAKILTDVSAMLT